MKSALLAKVQGRFQRGVAAAFSARRLRLDADVPYVSFTFDDFPRSALCNGGPILERFGLRATYYASFGLMGSVIATGRVFAQDDVVGLLGAGHELGCHTFDHCDSWSTRPDRFEASLARNQRALDACVAGCTFRSFSYPISVPRPRNKRIAGRRYASCRCGGQTFNRGSADLALLKAFFIEKSRDDLAAIRHVIDRNAASRGWLIFATHDIDENPTAYGCTPNVFESVVRYSVESGARILPVHEALVRLGAAWGVGAEGSSRQAGEAATASIVAGNPLRH